MRLVRQRGATDCGIACLAMLANIPYIQAKRALFGTKRQVSYDTTKDQMREALLLFGVITTKRLVVCTDPERLDRDALLHTNKLADGNSHWAVWDAKRRKILDPIYARGRTRPHSCLIVLRREHRESR